VFGALTGQVFSVVTVRRGFHFARLLPFLLGALVGLPLGLYLLPRIDVPTYKAIIGLILVVTCPLLYFAPRMPRITHGGRFADAVSGAVGGVMGGLGGSTGVVPTLWLTLRGWGKDEQRSIIQNFNLAALAVTFAAYLATGIVTARMLPAMAVVVPAIILPALAGRRIYMGISETGFRKLVLGLLTFSGAALLGSSLPRALGS
jgi:uncharacterized protein